MRWVLPLTIACIVHSIPASAEFIDFTATTRSASSSLTVGGVTITGQDGGAVSTLAGLGLGVGTDASFDAVMHFFTDGDSISYESLSADSARLNIGVNGVINSVTVQGYMVVNGPAPLDGERLSFQGGYQSVSAFGDGQKYFAMLPDAKMTLDFTSLDLASRYQGMDGFGLGGDATAYTLFRPYLLAHDAPDVTFSYGFSITSIDYTPTSVAAADVSSPSTAVPEPPVLELAVAALLLNLGLFVTRRSTPFLRLHRAWDRRRQP